MLKWKMTKEEIKTLDKIVDRGLSLYPQLTKMDLHMDIAATHCNGCKLKLKDLLEADDFNFSHDVAGIVNNINRETGELDNFFLPRYAA